MIIQRNETRTHIHNNTIQDAEEIIKHYRRAKANVPTRWVCEVCGMKHGVIAPDICDSCGASALVPQTEQHTEIGSRW